MAIFAGRSDVKRSAGRSWGLAALGAALGLLPLLTAPTMADTSGGGNVPGVVPGTGPGAFPTTGSPWWTGIRNEYIFASVGHSASFSTPTYNIPGRITVGNTGGSLRTIADDNTNLCGSLDIGGVGRYPSSAGDDWPIYLQARIDGNDAARVNVGFSTTDTLQIPDFQLLSDGPAIVCEYRLGNTGNGGGSLRLRQIIRLRRSLARFEWVVINTDSTSHNVELRWAMRYRSAGGFYYADPRKGATDRIANFIAADVPNDFTVYGRRAEAAGNVLPQFSSRQVFKLFDATAPAKLYVLNSADLQPGDTTPVGVFDPFANSGRPLEYFRNGIATAAYFNVSVPPGRQSNPIVTYVGNAAASESVSADFVTGVDGPESLIFNTAGALDATVQANKSNPALSTIGAQFLTSDNPDPNNPRRFQIFASVYNQKLNQPEFGVPFDGATASLTLPQGLRFATDPATGQADVASKPFTPRRGGAAGRIESDDDGIASWWVEATGTRYGALTYQISVSMQSPNPLSRSISRVINVPTPPIVSYPAGVFNMTGLPFAFDPIYSDNGLPVSILNTYVTPQDGNLVLFEYIGGSGLSKYRRVTQVVPGRGYFFKPLGTKGTDRIIYLKGAKPVTAQAPVGGGGGIPTRIQLEAGWNMISNPYVYEIPLSYLRFLRNDDNPTLDKVAYQAAVTSGLIRGGLYYYVPGDQSYQFLEGFDSTLRPWQAYWIYVNQRTQLEYGNPTLRGSLIQPTLVTPTNPDSEPATRKMLSGRDNQWTQQLVLRRADGAQDRATYIGIAPGVGSSDTQNLPKPPPIEDYVYTGLVREGSELRYTRLLQNPGNKRVWDVELQSDKDDSATLLWPDIARLPRRVTLSVTDLQTGRTVSMRSSASLPVTLRKGVPSRYRITAQMAASQPLRITQMTTRASRSGSQVAVHLSKDAALTARVLTQSGRVVQVLASGRAASGGQETLLSWNGRDGAGTALPSGLYVIEVVASGDGEESVLRRPLAKLR